MSAIIKQFIKNIERELQAGNATEHTHRTSLKLLVESIDPQVTATNEPKRIACGAPDYIITRDGFTIGYIEAKDVGKSLNELERTEQLKRYRRALENLILTDYLEFRWYVDGELRQEARLAGTQPDGKLKTTKVSQDAVEELLDNFLAHKTQSITTPKELAQRMARLTHIIRDIIIMAFETDQASILLRGWRDAFAKVLIVDINLPEKTPEFADMFAQTLAYGLFTARVMDTTPGNFSRHEAQYLIPKFNPFLRDFFIQISGPQLDDEPYASFVDDLVNLLANTDMGAVLADFGRRTRQEDPVVHFYETFLAAYDPKLRESRGVYYTPEPVVSYIVRSVDCLLKTRFDCSDGLADTSKITVPNYDPSQIVRGKKQTRKTRESHKVLILDPATGTGTFLYTVIDQIRQKFMQRGDAGMWAGYVKNHLLPRLFGFELLMAPYAIAHFKLSLQLAGRDLPEAQREQWAYYPAEGERLSIYLTNTLEETHEMTGLPLFTQWVADESNAANEVKLHLPVLVVMGNPPYSYESKNTGEWISTLIRDYYQVDGKSLDERNPKGLQDDYVKFIRFGQWRIEQTGSGILAFITNHGYLDNPTFRGMRRSLMQTFSEIYILNLHGNAKRKEITPDGSSDENVFDIQQGVTIGLFVKENKRKRRGKIYYADLWGSRLKKYKTLFNIDLSTMDWAELTPQFPFYLFVPQDTNMMNEYKRGWKLTDIFPANSVGFYTARDKLAIGWTAPEMLYTAKDFSSIPAEEAREKYNLGKDSSDWKVHLAQNDVKSNGVDRNSVVPVSYRPFDERFTYYTGQSRGFICRPRPEIMQNFLGNKGNLGLCFIRRSRGQIVSNFFVSKHITDKTILSSLDNANVAPLYIYPNIDSDAKQKSLLDTTHWPPDGTKCGRVPNLNPEFVREMEQKLGITFTTDNVGDMQSTFDPEDIFNYIYAVLHSPTYRERYAEFLKMDFPRVPLTWNVNLFGKLCGLGQELVGLHLLESPDVGYFTTRYPVPGEDLVEKGYPKYVPPIDDQPGRVYINKSQYFEGVPPEVWGFHVGGYQVLHKWLKDRRERLLSYEDLTHYQQVVVSLNKTIEIMARIDEAITEWPVM